MGISPEKSPFQAAFQDWQGLFGTFLVFWQVVKIELSAELR